MKGITTDLSDFQNAHQGRKAFICGAGPSVYRQDISGIHQHVVLAVNSACMLMPWDEYVDVESRFWVSNDILCKRWTYFEKYVKRAYCIKLVRSCWKHFYIEHQGLNFRYFRPRNDQDKTSLSLKEGGLCYVSSVPTAIDFSILLGCKLIFLVGVDHKMVKGKSHFWQFRNRNSNKPYQCGKKPVLNPEQEHQLRIFRKNIPVFEKLDLLATSRKCRIYNCSKISTVDIFPKITLDQALKM